MVDLLSILRGSSYFYCWRTVHTWYLLMPILIILHPGSEGGNKNRRPHYCFSSFYIFFRFLSSGTLMRVAGRMASGYWCPFFLSLCSIHWARLSIAAVTVQVIGGIFGGVNTDGYYWLILSKSTCSILSVFVLYWEDPCSISSTNGYKESISRQLVLVLLQVIYFGANMG